MTDDEQTEAIAVLTCRCDRVVTQSSQQTAALSIGFALTVDASNEDNLRNLSNLCVKKGALKAMKAAINTTKQVDFEGHGNAFHVSLQIEGPGKAADKRPQQLIGKAHKIRIQQKSEDEEVALVFIRPNHTEDLAVFLSRKVGVDLVATFSLEQTEMDFDKPDAPAAKASKKKAKAGKRTTKNPNK